MAATARLFGRPPRRRTRSTVVGPPAARAPDGVRPDAQATRARARGVGPAGAHGGVVGEHFDQQADGVESVAAADESGEGGVYRGEHLENKVVAGPQVGAFVGEDRRHLIVAQRIQRTLTDHDAAAYTRQAVGQRLCHIEDPQVVALRLADQVDDHPVVRPAAPGGDCHLQHGEGQPAHRSPG